MGGPERLDPDAALARPIAMLDALARGGEASYAWTAVRAPVLVLGRAASDPPLDLGLAERAGVQIRRRSSGGGAVLWDADLLALDVVLPPGHPLADRDVVRAYRWLGELLAAALSDLGATGLRVLEPAEARADREAAAATAAACFGSLSPYEVVADGRKLVGLSQVRRRHGALLQVGIPLAFDAPLLAGLLGLDAEAARALARRVVGLGELTPGIEPQEVVAVVERYLAPRGLSPAPEPARTRCA